MIFALVLLHCGAGLLALALGLAIWGAFADSGHGPGPLGFGAFLCALAGVASLAAAGGVFAWVKLWRYFV